MKPLRLGFIGGGINSAVGRAHYAACRMDGKFEVSAGCFSRDKEVNQKTADAYHCTAAKSPAEVILAVPEKADALVVLAPTPDHFAFVNYALGCGIPVVCEKALTSTSNEARQLVNSRNDLNGFLAVTYNYTGYPMVRELRDMVLSGELGEIVSIQAEMPQEGYLRDNANPQGWRKKDGPIPSVHLDLGTHLHHLIHYITDDRPASLVAHQQSRCAFSVVDDVRCIAEYRSGFTASLWFGKTAIGHRNGLRIRVNGTKASAEWVQANPEELTCASSGGHRYIIDRASAECIIARSERYQRFKAGHPAGFIEAYANLYCDLAEWLQVHKRGIGLDNSYGLLNLTPKMYGAEIAHEGLVMMEAMVQSAKEKRWITM